MMQVKAHAWRAKLEGDPDTFKRLTKGKKHSRRDKQSAPEDSSATPQKRWGFAGSTCDSAFLTDADVCEIVPGESLHSQSFFQIGKSGGRPTGRTFTDVPAEAFDFHVFNDPAYKQLDHELREARFWGYVSIPNPSATPCFFQGLFDKRWCFRTVWSAKDFLPVLRQQYFSNTGTVRPPDSETLPCLEQGHPGSADVEVWQGWQEGTQGSYDTSTRTIKVLFRVGRICGIFNGGYTPRLLGPNTHPGAILGKKKDRLLAATVAAYDEAFLALADRAVSRTLEAISEPNSLRV
jgi:hypothetical protein